MTSPRKFLNLMNQVALALLLVAAPAFLSAQTTPRAAELLEQLAQPDLPNWRQVERQLVAEWSMTGSEALDLLLRRGRQAIIDRDYEAAIEHLTALTDHAPDFAEGWHSRASAYYRAGLLGPAMSDLARAISLNPVHFSAIAGVGIILAESGLERQALEVFRAAHAIHPHHPTINRYLSELEDRLAGREA